MLVGLAFEALTEVGMRDPDERLSALSDRFPSQIHDAVLGDDVHDVGAWRGNDVARRQIQHDAAAALAALVVSGRQTDEGLAALRGVGAAHELQLSARPADVTVTVGLGSAL